MFSSTGYLRRWILHVLYPVEFWFTEEGRKISHLTWLWWRIWSHHKDCDAYSKLSDHSRKSCAPRKECTRLYNSPLATWESGGQICWHFSLQVHKKFRWTRKEGRKEWRQSLREWSDFSSTDLSIFVRGFKSL